MVQYVSVILFLVCFIHYIYQAIVLPSYRQKARDELFYLRDELRSRLIEIQSNADKQTLRAFKEVDDGINRSLNRLHLMTFTNFLKLAMITRQREEENKENKEFKRFYYLIENASDETPKAVFYAVNNVLERVLAVNSLMLMLYLLPFILVLKLFGTVYNKARATANLMADLCFMDKGVRIKGSNIGSNDKIIA
ncbi:hypothetical protein [Vibrio cincinnatiensis]|uniref:hypothetical protein n=1 Tax=Vibrio cincinnatiensis TaxID=675 RepID=UPI0013023BCE|nr:hypothetical protein [Vibrio cincinnatiensis]